jgi:hypothetical protein
MAKCHADSGARSMPRTALHSTSTSRIGSTCDATGNAECIATHSGQWSSLPGNCELSAATPTCAACFGSHWPWICTACTELAPTTNNRHARASPRSHKGYECSNAPRLGRLIKVQEAIRCNASISSSMTQIQAQKSPSSRSVRPNRLRQRWNNLKQIANDANICDLEDGSIGIFIDCNDSFRALHSHQVLDRSRDPNRKI